MRRKGKLKKLRLMMMIRTPSGEDSEEEVVFRNIEPTQRELAKFQIPEKDVLEDEHSVDSDDDFKDPPPKQINGCTDVHPDKTSIEIDSQYLIPDELLRSINLDYIHSEKLVQHDCRFRIPDEMLPSLNAYWRESITTHLSANCEEELTNEHLIDKKYKPVVEDHCQQIDVCFYYLRKKSKYDPNRSYKYNTVDYNFMNIIRLIRDVYSVDDPNLTAEGQEAHLNDYINGFHMHVVMPWNTLEDIYILVNIKGKHHWVLAVLSFSERCIFLYDSYESSGHYPAILADIWKLAKIIPLCLQACDFNDKNGIDLQNHPRYKEKDSSDLFDMLFEDNFPQQPSGSLDCGLHIVTYAECLSYGHKILSIEFDPSALYARYVALLWNYGIQKQEANAHSDFEALLRPARQSRITSVIEVFDPWRDAPLSPQATGKCQLGNCMVAQCGGIALPPWIGPSQDLYNWEFAPLEIDNLHLSLLRDALNTEMMVWSIPISSRFKLNTDGCSKGNPGSAGGRGILRDENGQMILAYSEYYGECSNNVAESKATLHRITWFMKNGFKDMYIESYSMLVGKIINEQTKVHFHIMPIIHQINKLKRQGGYKFQHCYRETNNLEDYLANLGERKKQSSFFTQNLTLPNGIKNWFKNDMDGSPFFRIRAQKNYFGNG
ncbi:hypothetical protein BC332_25253 [Capsicum chinense]|nr:hypothetical protein BC332_25253 [Capsicum chinense]